MKTTTKQILVLMGFGILLLFISCSKEWLNEKPGKHLVAPETFKDFQAILDAESTINQVNNDNTIKSSPYVFMADDDIGEIQEFEREMYTWQKAIHYPEQGSNYNWNYFFKIVESANLVLEGINKLEKNNADLTYLSGQAHFIRAFGYYHLAQQFCKQYIRQSATMDLGLPLRTSGDVNQLEKRANLQKTYDFIIADLEFASSSLPVTSKYLTRASKLSALAMLSKVHLLMQDYTQAGLYADSVLKVNAELIDFNDPSVVNHNNAYKFTARGLGNKEIIWYAYSASGYFEMSYLGAAVQVDHTFYNTYSNDDLRKEYFYGASGNHINFVGSYSGENQFFQGIATNEMYLIRSECNARLNNLEAAKSDLNLLLSKRYRSRQAPHITENNPDKLLSIILEHRSKEFPRVANIWWEDVRRLNLDTRFQKSLTRTVNGVTYSISPNDPRYVFPIPDNEILLSNMEQNER